MKVTVFGCGGWGSRVATKLAARPDVRLALVDADYARARRLGDDLELGDCCSGDPYGYVMVTGTTNGRDDRGRVVIATPPAERLRLVRAVLGGYGGSPESIRIEKPLAETEADAAEIVEMCADAGVSLTVGFTLLHHPLYEAAFAYLRTVGATPIHVDAVRIGRPARHEASALVDTGIHAAAIAAHIDVPASIAAAYDDTASLRCTRIYTSVGNILVDEVAGTVMTPHGSIEVSDGDALCAELDAWIDGTHRGTPAVALAAQRIIDAHTECVVAA